MRHPEGPRFHQRAEGSRAERVHSQPTPDPSLRLKSGTARDDATEEEAPNSECRAKSVSGSN